MTIPENVALPFKNTVAPVPAPIPSFAPSNVRFASSSSSPDDPAMTTRLSVKSPIAAVSAARLSIFAVPSMNKS